MLKVCNRYLNNVWNGIKTRILTCMSLNAKFIPFNPAVLLLEIKCNSYNIWGRIVKVVDYSCPRPPPTKYENLWQCNLHLVIRGSTLTSKTAHFASAILNLVWTSNVRPCNNNKYSTSYFKRIIRTYANWATQLMYICNTRWTSRFMNANTLRCILLSIVGPYCVWAYLLATLLIKLRVPYKMESISKYVLH